MKRMMMIAAAVAMLASSAHKDAYIISTGDNMTFNAGTGIDEFNALRKRNGADKYIWVRRGGREYRITDDTLLLRAEALFAPEVALGPEQAALGREEAQLDAEEARLEGGARTAATERRLAEIRARQKVVEQREKEVDEKQERSTHDAERAFWPLIDSAIRAGLARPVSR